MTKTAMHFHGRDFSAGSAHDVGVANEGGATGSTTGATSGGGGGGGGSGGGGVGRDVKPHQCQQCLKAFSSNHQLVQHIRVHTGEKPYKCSYCDRRFKQLSHVQQHTRLHTGERPYKCHVPDCGRAFIQLSNLQQHLRNHESQLERLKNRPFHCNICGKGFATESSLRTHNSKHTSLVGGPNPSCCPICQKVCLGGEALMEHMKYVHKDPNASGVPAKRRNANHPCPVCGKFYVNEGSLRKHLACHPEMSNQISSSLRMWPCSVCTAVFTHENGLLAHMDQMRMDPKHQFAAQYVLSRAANERREREALLAAAVNMSHFAMTSANLQPVLGGSGGAATGAHASTLSCSPTAEGVNSNPSTRISTPAEMKLEHSSNIRPLHEAETQHDYGRTSTLSSVGNLYGSGIMPGLQHHHLHQNPLDHHQLHQHQSHHSHQPHTQHDSKDTLSELQHQRQHHPRSSVATSTSNNEHSRVSSTLAANIHDVPQKEMPNDQLLSPAEHQDDETNSSTVVVAGKDQQQYLNELNPQEEEEHNRTHGPLHHEKVAPGEGRGESSTLQQEQLAVGRDDQGQHKGATSTTTTAAAAAAAAAAVSSAAPGSSRLDGLKQAFGNSILTGVGEGLSGSGPSLSSGAGAAIANSNTSFGSFSRPATATTALAATSCSLSSSSSDCFSTTAASASASVSTGFPTDLLSRYRLEQTLRHLHSFQDPRIAALPFNSSAAAATGIHQQDQL